jgi:pimeloyl-ACP methyl ester carboxylesterase
MEAFLAFHTTHPAQEATIDGVTWDVIIAGEGDETLLFLPDTYGVPDMLWRHIAYFAQRGRVVAPAYPPLRRMDDLVDGLVGLLRLVGVERAHLIGDSYGGFVAQSFARRHPDMTSSLVLSHTLPPDSGSGDLVRAALMWMQYIPMFLLRGMIDRQLRQLMPPRTEETALAHAIFSEAIRSRLTKEGVLAGYWRLVDFNTAEDAEDWQGPVQVMLSEDDPSIPLSAREALEAVYPQAETHIFERTGHAAALLKPDEYRTVIERFIDR